MSKTVRYLALFAIALIMTGCGYTKIGRIQADPYHYRNRTVRVEGNVTKSAGALFVGGYQIDDGTGRIYVISDHGGVPRSGARVAVTGSVVNGVQLMGRSFGTAIREHNHRLKGY